MKNLLQELNNIKDDASLRNFVENANEEKLLNACLL